MRNLTAINKEIIESNFKSDDGLEGYIKIDRVLELLKIGRTSLYAGIKAGIYPSPTKIGIRSSRWPITEIRNLIEQLNRKEGEMKGSK